MALVGHYKLNGNATDSSGSGYHGTVSGASLAVDKNGIANNCYEFEYGTGDLIWLYDLQKMPLNFTISMWIYEDRQVGDAASVRRFYGGQEGSTSAFGFGIQNNSAVGGLDMNLGFGVTSSPSEANNARIVWALQGVTNNAWNHVVCIKDDLKIYIYLNGIKGSTTTDLLHSEYRRPKTMTLGGVGGYSSAFRGKIDDVRIYDTVLSLKEIKELAKGKFAHYKFDGNAKDCSGNDLHGTAYNNISYNRLTPLIGSSSLSIPGTANNDYIALPFGNGFNPSIYNLSISMWIKFNGVITDKAMIISSSAGSNERFYIGYNTGTLWIGVQNKIYTADIITNLNERVHLGITFNKSTLKVNIYYNGILAGSYDYTSYAFSRNIWLGTHIESSYTWNGLIDDVQFFSTALTQQDFIDIMQTSASITDKGDIIVNEIDEVGAIASITKNKQLKSSEIIEDLGGIVKFNSDGTILCNEIKEII